MKKLQSFIAILAVVVKWAGVAMVIVDTVKYFNERLKKEVGSLEADNFEPEKPDTDGSKLA